MSQTDLTALDNDPVRLCTPCMGDLAGLLAPGRTVVGAA
tara:strand:- start:874 stop:990 length:117 start_codon:yes stop_codon:yes gene_type:complete